MLQNAKRIWTGLSILLLCACANAAESQRTVAEPSAASEPGDQVLVSMFGMLHGTHRSSRSYSLSVIDTAVRNFNPDYVLVELPPQALGDAQKQFNRTGRISSGRARAFPELTDVVFPLQKKLGFEIIPVAAWTRAIADKRRKVLNNIRNDPARRGQWQEHQAAINQYNRTVGRRFDDPQFIHTKAYDAAVEARYGPHRRYFDKNIGAGGWQQINAAHYVRVDRALNRITAKARASKKAARVLIVYGAWHKYWFLRELRKRRDIGLVNARQYYP